MTNPWSELDLGAGPPYVLKADAEALEAHETLCDGRGSDFADRYGYRTSLIPDPYTGQVDAPIVMFTLNPGYTDEAKALRWKGKGCTGSDDWWHENSEAMRDCYRANLRQEDQEYPLFFLDPRLRGSPGGVYYRNNSARSQSFTESGALRVRFVCLNTFRITPRNSRI